jgi:hypothetical protein
MSSFYIWLRLIDKFHNREIEGKNISEMYNMIFIDSEFYENSCRMSYAQILEHQIKEKQRLEEAKIEAEKQAEFERNLAKKKLSESKMATSTTTTTPQTTIPTKPLKKKIKFIS